MDAARRVQTYYRANILGQPEFKPYPTVQLELRAREKIHEQRQSALLSRLSLEIRVMINQMVLMDLGHTRHIPFEDGRLLGVKCVANAEEPILLVDASHYSDWGKEHASCQELAGRQRDPGILRTVMRVCRGLAGCQEDTDISNDNPSAYLLRSCIHVYSEMIDMLYSSTTFSFISLYSATEFLSRTTSQRLNTIKSLYLSWIIPSPLHANGEQALELKENYSPTPSQVQWENVCHVIGTMARLVDVKFTIYNAKTSPKLLLPLWAVRVEKFLVGLSYSKNLDTVGAPFQVRMLASQDNQISFQLETSLRGPNPG